MHKPNLRAALSRMFMGRCGIDNLSGFLLKISVLPLLLSILTPRIANGYVSLALYCCAMLFIIWGIWRAFSRNIAQRKRENEHFLASGFYKSTRGFCIRFSQRKDYRFFRCPTCKNWLRVPRGKGSIEIRCPHCSTLFKKST